MKKLLFLVGTRPEVIKIAPLLRAVQAKGSIHPLLCTSGQHGALLTTALADEKLTPDLSFYIEGELSQKAADCLSRLDPLLVAQAPDAIAVHGDTLTAFAGAVCAFHRRIPVFHIEAGLRTQDPHTPFPEEFYRRAIDTLATLHFAPTPLASAHLLQEGVPPFRVHTVGNTAIDSLFSDLDPHFTHPLTEKEQKLVLLTLHRRESLGEPLKEILTGIRTAVAGRCDCHLFFPMHPNPCIRTIALPLLAGLPNVTLTSPVDAHTFRNLLSRATLVLTDSGGVSEECTALGIPTLLLRDVTERTEGVDAGVLFPVGRKRDAVAHATRDFLDTPRKCPPSSVFGDGHAALRIADIIEEFFRK